MTVLTCASTGKSITLLKEIAHSGEAKIWRTNENGYLAKIYHSPTPERVQKLAVMIDHPPTEPNSHLHHVSFAWPKSVLKNDQGNFVGFLMPEIKNGKELIDVYNPRRRQTLKLEIDWRFLHTTALNIVSIIEALHAAGYVLGDIKPQNILVNNRALPSIIDTDSFQVKNPNNGKVYRCLVGSEGYTPPELMGKDFDIIEQTEIHDRFRLGVIIYQLLFGGNSPFQGKWTGAGETPEPNELIRRGLWVNGSNNLIVAAARTIPLEIVHPEIQQCFLKCFNDGHNYPNLRPTARQWLEALRTGNDNLTICGRVDSHYYSRTFGNCYWCDRSTNLGVDIFPGVVKVNSSASQPQVNSNQFIENLLQTLTGHSHSVNSVAYSPDGQTLASGSNDNTIKLWNVNTGKLLQTLKSHSYSVNSVAYSPDSQTLASASGDNTIKLWNVKTGELLQTLKSHSVNSVAYSPDGQILSSASGDKTIKLWNVKTGELLQTFTGHSNGVYSVAYSPDGQTLASGSFDYTIKLWNVKTRKLLQTLTGHSSLVSSVAYSPDGQTLASASGDKTIKIWQIPASISKAPVQQPQSQVSQPVISTPPSQYVIGLIALFLLITPGLVILSQILSQIYYNLYTPSPTSIANLSSGISLEKTLEGHSDSVSSVAYSPNGQTLASGGGEDKTIKLWNVKTGKLLQTLKGHSEGVTSVAYSPDGQTLASGSYDKTIKLWNVKTGKLLQTLKGHSKWVTSVAYSPDGQTLASGSYYSPDGETLASEGDDIKLWNVKTGKLLQTLKGHFNQVSSVAYSPDGQTLASADDKTIKLWDIKTGNLLQTLEGHSYYSANSVAYSPDGQTLASGSSDKTIKLWDVKTGELLQTLEGHSNTVTSVAYSPDGQTLASGSYDKTIKLWNVKTGKLLQTLEDHFWFVQSVAYSPDGQTLASGSGDDTIKIWRLK